MEKPLKARKMKYHHGNLREQLLGDARDLLEEVGHSSICLRELARRSGVSHAAPYRHFKDKKALLKALVLEGHSLVQRISAKSIESPDPKEKLFRTMTRYVQFGLANPELHQLIFGSNSLSYTDADVRFEADTSLKKFVVIVHAALPEKKKIDANLIGLSLWSLAHGVLLLTPNPKKIDGGICQRSVTDASSYMKSLRHGMEALISESVGEKWKNPYLF